MSKKINWLYVAIIAAVIILVFIFFRGCYKLGKVETIKVVTVDTTGVADLRKRAAEAERAQAVANKAKDSALKELVLTQFRSRNLAAKYEEARERKDTVEIIKNCDSLANEVEVLNETLDNYKGMYDDLLEAAERSKSKSDSMALLNAQFVAQYRGLYAGAVNDRNQLAVQLNKTNKKVKRERFLTRVLAGAVLAVGTYAAIK